MITGAGLSEIEKNMIERKQTLELFTKVPFDPNNQEQLTKLKKYIDDYEYSLNQMYLFDSIGSGLNYTCLFYLANKFLPLPEFINSFQVMFFYCGLLGYALRKFNTNDFCHQVQEMKTL